jgi:hypothetical protein
LAELTVYAELASDTPKNRVPWVVFDAEQDILIDKKYIPEDLRIRDPSRMKKEELRRCINLWREVGFRFSMWLDGSEPLPAVYRNLPDLSRGKASRGNRSHSKRDRVG